MIDLTGKLYISTISLNAAELAREHCLGLEITEFCTAYNMDADFEKWDALVKKSISGTEKLVFHAPFNELCPAAVDPLVVEFALKRYTQAYELMDSYGVNTMVVHSGYMPILYDKDWFTLRSIKFWKEFLSDKPDGFRLYIENIFEQTPELLREIVGAVNDNRFRLCFDVGHATVYGKGIPAAGWVERTAPFLGHVHLNNNDGEQDTHNAPGDGVADVETVIRKVMELSPETTFTIEAIDAAASLDWLRANGFMQMT